MSSVVGIASGITVTGTTTPVTVAQARLYLFQVGIASGTATVVPEFSVDGNFWFAVAETDVSTTAGTQVYRLVDLPVILMRLNVTAISGATVRASVAVPS